MRDLPADWPRCPVCGEPAFEAHVSCCRRSCHELAAQHFGKVLKQGRLVKAQRRYIRELEAQLEPSVIEEIKAELSALKHEEEA